MKSPLPKVLTEVSGQPILFHTLDKVLRAAPDATIGIIVGYAREKVEAAVRAHPVYGRANITFIVQQTQKGTGHAARCGMESAWGQALVKKKRPVLVLPGDFPLLRTELITQMMEPLPTAVSVRLLTTHLADPTSYGRVVRRGKEGPVLRIVEEKDANQREKEIHEVATSIYSFQSAFLTSALDRISDKNAQKEYYLTDVVAQAARTSSSKKRIDVLKWLQSEDLIGVNNPWELTQAEAILNQRGLKDWAMQGVRFLSPSTTFVNTSVRLSPGVSIGPGVVLCGQTTVGEGTTIGPHCVLKDVEIGAGAEIKAGTVAEKSRIGDKASVGPYAHLRPDSEVGASCKIGNFVELKKTRVGAKTNIAHLSYLGDAEVGSGVNIGCGFITCNFDGRVIDGSRKHKTIIEDDVFMGSDCQVVAPRRIGRGAYVASGSTITKDVAADELAFARARQVNKAGYAKRFRDAPAAEHSEAPAVSPVAPPVPGVKE